MSTIASRGGLNIIFAPVETRVAHSDSLLPYVKEGCKDLQGGSLGHLLRQLVVEQPVLLKDQCPNNSYLLYNTI